MKLENIRKASDLFIELDMYNALKTRLKDSGEVWNIHNAFYSDRFARLPEDVVENMREFVNKRIEEVENQIKEL